MTEAVVIGRATDAANAADGTPIADPGDFFKNGTGGTGGVDFVTAVDLSGATTKKPEASASTRRFGIVMVKKSLAAAKAMAPGKIVSIRMSLIICP